MVKTNSQLRQESRALLSGHWGAAVVATLICLVIGGFFYGLMLGDMEGGSTFTLIFWVAYFLILSPLMLGYINAFYIFIKGEQPIEAANMFKIFSSKYYWKTVGVYFLNWLYTTLWTLLLVIPGVIKGLSYSLAPYILLENPEIGAEGAIKQSMKMMKGHKGRLFLMLLGMMGLTFVSMLLLGIPMLWLTPYYQTVFVKFYLDIKENYVEA